MKKGSFHVSFLLFFLLFILSLYADAEKKNGASAGVASADAETIKARITELEEAGETGEPGGKVLIDAYRKLLEHYTRTGEWLDLIREFDQAQQDSPEQLKNLHSELSNFNPDFKPEPVKDATLARLEQEHTEARAGVLTLKSELSDLESRIKKAGERRLSVPVILAEGKQQLDSLSMEEGKSDKSRDGTELSRVLEMSVPAQRKRYEARIMACEKELLTFDARLDVLKLSRELAAKKLELAEKKAAYWEEQVAAKRKEYAEQDARKAKEALAQAANAHPEALKLAQENDLYAQQRTGKSGLVTMIESVSGEYESTSKALSESIADFVSIREKIGAAGLTNAMGMLLRVKRSELPDIRILKKRMERRQALISACQLKMIELEERLAEVSDIDALLLELDSAVKVEKEKQRDFIRQRLRELLETRREYLGYLIRDYNTYFMKLVDLDSLDGRLLEHTEAFSAYIDERILWIRSSTTISPRDFVRSLDALAWLLGPGNWLSAGKALFKGISRLHIVPIAILLILTLLIRKKKNMKERFRLIKEGVRKVTTDRFSYTVEALVITILNSAIYPLVLLFFYFLLSYSGTQDGFSIILTGSLRTMLPVVLILCFADRIFCENGLADAHFFWKPPEALALFRRMIRFALIVIMPLLFFCLLLSGQPNESFKESLGRIVYICAMLAAAWKMYSLLKPDCELYEKMGESRDRFIIYRCRYALLGLFSIFPLVLSVLAAAGYFFTSQQLFYRAALTLLLGFVLLILYAMIIRVLTFLSRSLAIRKAEEIREMKEEERKASGDPQAPAVESVPTYADLQLDVIGKQTRKFFSGALVIALLAGIWFIWRDVSPALRILDRVHLWNTMAMVTEETLDEEGSMRVSSREMPVAITLFDLLAAIAVIVITISAARNLPSFLDVILLSRLPMDRGALYAIRTITRYSITGIGIVAAFRVIGIGWDKVQWLAAGVSVGLGFGLQEIFANFVSGLIILFERPVRVNDIVTVGDTTGTVSTINIRATTITNWDRKEIIIPNRELITNRLVNWTLTDRVIRVVFKVGVAYGTDADRVREILLGVARDHRKVLSEPPSRAVMLGFGDSSLDFELRVFIPNMDEYQEFLHEINSTINKRFAKEEIEIPFPQRDVHIINQ